MTGEPASRRGYDPGADGLAGPSALPTLFPEPRSRPMSLAIPEGTTEDTRRFLMLNRGADLNWFEFQSSNPPGFTDHKGVRYAGGTYSLLLHDGTPITLTEAEVEGFVYATALENDGVEEINYRDGM